MQYNAASAFLAAVYADYLSTKGIPGWNCGPSFLPSSTLRDFSRSQVSFSQVLVVIEIVNIYVIVCMYVCNVRTYVSERSYICMCVRFCKDQFEKNAMFLS